ncbi:hypothetical protein AO287_21170 [Pseudomonas savastanoi]|uniref:Uncharacterized protein n=1 Tax=Pseudomonas savastanoi TaxID=29438 RepID=A0AAW3LR15_PSESS|nr:hypothetical protein AO287_21170 [Pseudomonas savastanoi]
MLFGRRLSELKLSASVLAPTRVLRTVTVARASMSLGVCESSSQVEVPSGQPFHDEKRRLDMRLWRTFGGLLEWLLPLIAVTEPAGWRDLDSGIQFCRIGTLDPLKARKVRRKGMQGLDLS